MVSETTCWTLIQGAARGVHEDIEAFVRLYAPVVRTYIAARWQASPLRSEVDDAAQEVFVECFKEGGVLDRADPDALGSFHAFLLGVARNVSLRVETRKRHVREIQPPTAFDPDHMSADDPRLSEIFDRAWAQSLLREAVKRQGERAEILGPESRRRVELLRLRFQEGLKLREIAERWGSEPRIVKKQNARALTEFEDALRQVIAFQYPNQPDACEQEIVRLLTLIH